MSTRWEASRPGGEDVGNIIVAPEGGEAKRTGGMGAFAYSKLTASAASYNVDGTIIVAVISAGQVGNIAEVREELYGCQIEDSKKESPAQLVLDLYMKGFSDQYGDLTDQPATALACLRGSFTFVLLDAEAGYCLAARSGPDAPPLFWGTSETGTLIFSGDEAAIAPHVAAPRGGASFFPGGCFYECSRADEKGRLVGFTRRIKHRAVQPLNRIDSRGQLCGLGFYTESGSDLASLAVGAVGAAR